MGFFAFLQAFAELSEKLVPLLDGVRDNRAHWIDMAEDIQKQRSNESCKSHLNNNNIVGEELTASSSELSLTSKIVGKFALDSAQQLHNYLKQNGSAVWIDPEPKDPAQSMDQWNPSYSDTISLTNELVA